VRPYRIAAGAIDRQVRDPAITLGVCAGVAARRLVVDRQLVLGQNTRVEIEQSKTGIFGNHSIPQRQ
jgi:hypothetical protein